MLDLDLFPEKGYSKSEQNLKVIRAFKDI